MLKRLKKYLPMAILVQYHKKHSQNLQAVKPYRQNWLFYCPNTAQSGIGASPSYLGNSLSSYDGVILQNKPFGEYAERFLVRPRVNPITLFLGVFLKLKTLQGVFPMNTHIIGNHAIITIPTITLSIPLALYYVLCFVGFVVFTALHIALFWVFVALGGVL